MPVIYHSARNSKAQTNSQTQPIKVAERLNASYFFRFCIRQKENWSSGKEGYTRVATSLYGMVVPTATSPCIWEASARKAPIISILQNGIVAFLFLYESHYSDSQHCGNDQRKQNEASDLSVGCLLSLWQCVFSRRLQKSPIVCQRVTGFWEQVRNEIMGMYRHESELLPPEECFFQIDLNSV